MGFEWISMLPSIVRARIIDGFSKSLAKTYGMESRNFSPVGSSDTPAVFPFVYIQLLPAVEQGRDLEGTAINAGLFTFQIDVIDNGKQDKANKVAFEIMRLMKKMEFEVIQFPYPQTDGKVYRSIARYRRCITESDVLNTNQLS